MAKKDKRSFGSWAFLIGFVLALIFGTIGINDFVAWVLVLVGLVVGFLNITDSETQQFMIGGTVLVIVSALGENAMALVPLVGNILNAILMLFIPATIIVALKHVFQLAKD